MRQQLGLITELVGLGFWFAIDLVMGTAGQSPLSIAAASTVGGLALLRRVPRIERELVAALAIAVSLGFSVQAEIASAATGDYLETMVIRGFSFTEELALAILVVSVLRGSKLRTAMPVTAAAAVAIVWAPLGRIAGELSFAVICAVGSS